MFITSVRLNLENEHISVLTLLCVYVRYNALGYTMGGDIGGTVPQNLRCGMAHASDPPKYLEKECYWKRAKVRTEKPSDICYISDDVRLLAVRQQRHGKDRKNVN